MLHASSPAPASLLPARLPVLAAPDGGLLVAPGLGVDIEDVAVLSEAVDEGAETRGVVKDRAPLLEGEVGRDDDGARFVATTDDVKEQIRGPPSCKPPQYARAAWSDR